MKRILITLGICLIVVLFMGLLMAMIVALDMLLGKYFKYVPYLFFLPGVIAIYKLVGEWQKNQKEKD